MLSTVVRWNVLAATLIAAASAVAQAGHTYTDADYSRAAALLAGNTKGLVDHAVTAAYPMAGDRFWYLDIDHGVATPMVVDAKKGTKAAAYDVPAMDLALHTAGLGETDPHKVNVENLEVQEHGAVALITVGNGVYRCGLSTPYQCTRTKLPFVSVTRPRRSHATEAVLSPDGKRAVFIRNWNLWVRDVETRAERQLTKDGVENFGYATDNAGWQHTDRTIALWAPDSRHVATFQQDQRDTGTFSTMTTENGHPKVETWKYPFVGDAVVTTIQRVIVDADTATTVRLQMPPDQHRSTLCDDVSCGGSWDDVQWAKDSQTLAFVSTSRDHKREQVRIAVAATGAVRDVFEETASTFLESGYGSVNWRYLSQRKQVLWWSQRSNWGQLSLFSSVTGQQLNAVTTGAWNVDEILLLNEDNGDLLLTGMGREPGADPYYRKVYRTNLDGKEIRLLTPEDADHTAAVSADGQYLVDSYSTPQVPPVAVLRDRNGKVVTTLAEAYIGRLKAVGWVAPETFHVKGHDGKTDVYGLLFRPAGLDAARKYPVIDYIYPGPQGGSFGSHGFAASRGDSNALAQLGFAVVHLEGMGNPKRSKAFHDAYLNDIGINALPDQVSGLKELAARDPWIDMGRTGMWGHSGGGNATAATMFRYPGFIKVGIAESGNHQNLDYEDDWDEKWVGLLQRNADGTSNYDSQANAQYAKNLTGKLMLAHGLLDDNVPVENTMLVVDALEKANKNFDLVLFPRAHHGYGDMGPYMMRRRWDYFVANLMVATPPMNFLMPRNPAPEKPVPEP